MVIDFRIGFPPTKEGIKGFLNPAPHEATIIGKVNRAKDRDPRLEDSPVLKGRTWREALENLVSEPDPVSAFLQILDEVGISHAVFTAGDSETVTGRKLRNEVVADFVRQRPDRLIGFAGVDPNKGMAAVRELEWAVKELGMRGLAVSNFMVKLPANHKKLYPLYAKCVELDIPVMLHCSVNFAHFLSMEVSHPLHLDEVAVDFPELKIVASHAGWPWVSELVAVAWRQPNVYICINGYRHKYMAMPNTGWEQLIHYGNSVIQDKILFASQWPGHSFKECINDVRSFPLRDSVKEKWLWQNAAKLLGISPGQVLESQASGLKSG